MFTGLVEETGVLSEILDEGDDAKRFVVRCALVSGDAEIGASIAINGCCLTVVDIAGELLAFQAGSETLSRTNLGELSVDDIVNLERAVKASDRLGGHIVSGHVDAVGTVAQRIDSDDWSEFWFEVPASLTRQMASKGSVTVDGISLTLVEVEETQFSVALIPHTLAETTLGRRQVGDGVNIETDVLAKYVEKQLSVLRK